MTALEEARGRVPETSLAEANDPALVPEALEVVRAIEALLPKVLHSIRSIYDALPGDDSDLAGDIADGTRARQADTILMVAAAHLQEHLGGRYCGPVTWADVVNIATDSRWARLLVDGHLDLNAMAP